jgi:hypothetical protein
VRRVDQARRDLLAAARAYLELTAGPSIGPLTVLVACGPVATASAESCSAPPSAASAPSVPPGLPPVQRALLPVLTSEPEPARRVARRAGRPYNSYLRSALAVLVERGLARRTRRGYLLA